MEFIYSKRWCELLFENRNKNYGAYQIRMREADNTVVAWIISATLLGATILALAWSGGPSKELVKKFTLEIPPVTDIFVIPFTNPPPKVETPKTTSVTTANHLPVVVDDKIITEDKKIVAQITPLNPIGTDTKGTDVVVNANTGGGLTPVEVTQPVLVPDVMPEFPGGEEAMLRYLQKNIHYPFHLLQSEVSGTVYLSFVIDKDGSVSEIKILRVVKDGEALADEATRVVSKMPQWKPGVFEGKNVPVLYKLPVNFIVK